MTKKEMFVTLNGIVENSEYEDKASVIEFINHEIELLDKKSSRKTMTAVQKANLEIKENIKAVLRESNKPLTISDMMKDGRLSCYQNQKLSALVRQIPEVVRTVEKKKAYFSLVSE